MLASIFLLNLVGIFTSVLFALLHDLCSPLQSTNSINIKYLFPTFQTWPPFSTMRSSKTSLPLGDSWAVLKTSDSDQADNFEEDLFEKRMRAQRKLYAPRSNDEPDFIMPSPSSESNAEDGLRLRGPKHSLSASVKSDDSIVRRRSPRTAPKDDSVRRRSERHYENYPRRENQRSASSPSRPKNPLVDMSAIFSWLFDIIGGAFKFLKYPLTLLLAIWLSIGMVMLAQNFFMYSIGLALSPLCRIPVLSMLAVCPATNVHKASSDGVPVAFEKAVEAQANLEDLLEQSSDSKVLRLPMEMKNGERLVRDLHTLVTYSDINSKNEILLELRRYIDLSSKTTESLTSFNSHIGRTVDYILAVSKYTIRVLDSFQIEEQSHGAISQFWGSMLAPFQPVKLSRDVIFDQFIEYTKTIEDEIVKLLQEAELLQKQLYLMDSSTDSIGEVSYKNEKHATAQKDEIYSWLWTRVGGNRSKVKKVNSTIELLQKINLNRKSAATHVSNIILRLLDTKAQLENLRSQVAQPDLIQETLPLSVHIEIILAGTERLENIRSDTRDREITWIRSAQEAIYRKEDAPLELDATRSRRSV